MPEYIERGTAIKRVMETKWESGSDGAAAMEIVAAAPAADVAPVVRCKDCRCLVNAVVNSNGFLICSVSDMETAPDDFCSHGERRKGDGAMKT